MARERSPTDREPNEDAYRALVDGVQVGVLLLQRTRVVFANPAVTAATGYTLDELLGWEPAEILDRLHPEDQARVQQRLAARDDTHGGRAELRLRCKDGSWRWFEASAHRILFRGQAATAATLVDATDRKRAERDLIASDARLRLIVEGRNEYTIEIDGDGTVVHASPGMIEALGIPLEGLSMAQLMADRVHPDDQADGTRNVAGLLTGGVLDDAIHRIRQKDGEYRWWETSARPLETDGGRHVVILSRDVTERLAAREARDALNDRLHRTEKLEGLGLLAGGIAHDFNNLMVAVRTNAELAVRAIEPRSAARGFLDDIGLAAEHARDLTRKLLAYAGRTSTAVETVDLSRVAAGIAQLFRGSLTERTGLSSGADDAEVFVVGDEAQLGQLVLNLLRNAEEAFAGEPGTISLRTGLRALTERDLATCLYADGGRPGSYACISVVDTGPGVAPEHVGRIFDPFFTTKESGRGLGLASVLGTVRAHHGALRLVTRLGGGTRFEIYLPAVESGEERARTPVAADATPIRGAILVVDDQTPVRRAAAQLLQSRGYATLEAGGGREAVEIARKDPEALGAVLLDVTMPGLGGNRVFAELRRMRADLPIVFMSGHSEEDVAALTKDRTRVATIAKPFTGAEVLAALKRVTSEEC